MNRPHADLEDYYEKEARLGTRGGPRGPRVELRTEFIELLHAEGRATVVDYGAGPGTDGGGFTAAGFGYVGLDLAHGNGALATDKKLTVIQGTITAVPFPAATFDAGWSMSTLMHLDDADASVAAADMLRTIKPGAPFMLGMWGCETEASVMQSDGVPGATRPFHVRSFDHNQAILSAHGEIDRADRWVGASGDWDYHVLQVRAG